MSDGAGEAVENAPAVATTDPPTTPVARVASTDAVNTIGGTSGGDADPTPPAFTEEDLARMEEERVRVQELYLREADLKRREKAVAVAELSSPESLASMNAERMRRAENFRLEALAKKATRGDDGAPPPPPTAAATSPAIPVETAWMERERLERRARYELEAFERRRAAERAVTAEDVLRRKEAEASARRAMAEAMYAPSFVPPPSAVLGPDGGSLSRKSGNDDDGGDDAVETVTLEEARRRRQPTTTPTPTRRESSRGDRRRGATRGTRVRAGAGVRRGGKRGKGMAPTTTRAERERMTSTRMTSTRMTSTPSPIGSPRTPTRTRRGTSSTTYPAARSRTDEYRGRTTSSTTSRKAPCVGSRRASSEQGWIGSRLGTIRMNSSRGTAIE